MPLNRIPPRGTKAYRNYWRDRRVMDEIDRVTKEVRYCAEDTEPQREDDYKQALECILLAKLHLKQGWSRARAPEPGEKHE